MAFALWKYNWLRWFGVGYAISMLFAVVYLGEHYAVDGFAGLGVAAAAWVGVRALLTRHEASEEEGAEEGAPTGAVPGEPSPAPGSASPVTTR